MLAQGACTANRRCAQTPAVGGISTSHHTGPAGTIGCFCRTIDPAEAALANATFVLSCNHIYARFNGASPGALLCQPAVSDGAPGGSFATLHRFVPLTPSPLINRVDAAIGRVAPGLAPLPEICTIGRVTATGTAKDGDEVQKHGRTTGHTLGLVDDENIDCNVILPGSSAVYFFKSQMRIIPQEIHAFALSGDSGSLIVRRDATEALGLLHATAPDGSYAYASHIADVLNLLQIQLL
jgi:hypothetical protein